MKKSFNRLTSIFMIVMMLVTTMGLPAYATDITALDGNQSIAVNENTKVEYTDLQKAVDEAKTGEAILLYADVDSFPAITKPVTIKGAPNEEIKINAKIAENFPNIVGEVVFENLTFNQRISTEHVSTDQSGLTLKFENCVFNMQSEYAIQAGSTGSDPDDVLGALIIEDCTFNNTSKSYIGNYMVYAQCVNSLSITNSVFNGNSLYKGAVHTGDSIEFATVATIEGNTFNNFPRGIQIGNRVAESSVSVNDNTFDGIKEITNETKSGAVYVHGNADNNVTVSITNNVFSNTECEQVLYNDGNVTTGSDHIGEIVTTFEGNTLEGQNLFFDRSNGNVYVKDMPALPTATVTELDKEDLTFALNFEADKVTDEQLAYYGNWYADFVLTVNKEVTFNANGGADGYLSGQYDAWSESWVNVPFEDVTLKANESLKIMEYAAKLMDQTGLKYTYAEVYEAVKNFDCGVFFEDAFLKANPDLEVTLELRMFNPADESESYVVGETYEFNLAPKLPTATVTELEKEDLTFALNFKADEATKEQLAYYGDWFADFELTVNKDVTFNANGGADGYLSGQYDQWSENWINVPYENVTLKAGETLKIMEYASKLMGQSGLKVTYNDVATAVKDFDCGVFFTEEFLAANEDLEVTLELKMYNPEDESESYVIGKTYEFDLAPELPTATVKPIDNDNLTFALNFKADEVTDKQLAYYGDWYADYVLTINKDVTFNANGTKDGYLSGQYDEWSENWVNVPPEDVTLKANESLKVMEYAAKLMDKEGLKLTYNDVYTSVKDFDCGVYFTPEFLAANDDLEVKLELRMYNPEDESESYVIGTSYAFPPAVPTATVTEIANDELTFALNFKADEATADQLAYFGDWYADFEIKVNQDITFNADGSADGYLSGQYDEWSENWVNVPFNGPVTLEADKPLKIMEFASKLMGQTGLKVTYSDVYNAVKDFDCGVYLDDEYLSKLEEDLIITLELRMYHPEDETKSYVIGETYTYEVPNEVCQNINTGKVYGDLETGLTDAEAGQTVILLRPVKVNSVLVPANVTLDLGGYKLTTDYFACCGYAIDDSDLNSGLLSVPTKQILIQKNNKQFPLRTEAGYKFYKVLKWNEAMLEENVKCAFQPFIETAAHEEILKGAAATGVTVNVEATWTQNSGDRTQSFVYNDRFVQDFLGSYNAVTTKYSKMFTLTINNATDYDFNYRAYIKSDTGVEIGVDVETLAY